MIAGKDFVQIRKFMNRYFSLLAGSQPKNVPLVGDQILMDSPIVEQTGPSCLPQHLWLACRDTIFYDHCPLEVLNVPRKPQPKIISFSSNPSRGKRSRYAHVWRWGLWRRLPDQFYGLHVQLISKVGQITPIPVHSLQELAVKIALRVSRVTLPSTWARRSGLQLVFCHSSSVSCQS